ncbi:MAG: SIS domain-containing protein [Anaerolineaceae bacterium]|nr:SIS domain-containing protein [Anaerolineaceae bacterium]
MRNQLPVALATPSVFSVYKNPPDLSEALVLAISQSGKSPDIISVVEEANKQGRPTVAITNDPDSPLAQAADEVIPLHAGIEKAIAATKTYTSSLVALAMLSSSLSADRGMSDEIAKLPRWTETALAGILPLVGRMERYRFMEHFAVIGRGYNYCTAFEIALKVKELTGVVAEPYSSADFLHGPIATIHKGFPVLVVAHTGKVHNDLKDTIRKLVDLGAEVITISDDPIVNSMVQFPISISNGIPEWLSPVPNVLPGQIFGWQLAVQKGLDPDFPKGLIKVTETV